MRELLKLYVQSKKDITKAQYDYIKKDEDLLLYYLAAGNRYNRDDDYIKQYVKLLNESKQKYLIKRQSKYINFIDNPSLELQLAAVKQNGYIIQYINNPSETVQLAAVKQNELAIKYIENPYPSVLNYVKSLKK